MDFSSDILMKIAVFILGTFGFWLAWHVYNKKKKQQPLVCPIRFDCNTVINSDYSRFLGIPVEFLGMLYYGIIALAYISLILAPGMWSYPMTVCISALSLVAFIFSMYLMWVQAFILKNWCSWCVVSASLCTLIFFLAIAAHGFWF